MRFPSTIGRTLERSARRTPDRLALTFAERRWSFAELDRAAGRVAAALLAAGLERGDRVAAFGKNSDAYLLLFLGCARAGLVHVPVNFNARGEELRYLLTHSAPRLVLVDPALTEFVDVLAATMLDVLGWALDEGAPIHDEAGVGDEDLAQLLYTSGTTSRPKGAMLTHRALI